MLQPDSYVFFIHLTKFLENFHLELLMLDLLHLCFGGGGCCCCCCLLGLRSSLLELIEGHPLYCCSASCD